MNIEMIRAAALRLEGHARVTPLLNAPLLDRIAGRRVMVKAECLQWTGSFKYRGGWAAVSALRGAAACWRSHRAIMRRAWLWQPPSMVCLR